MKPTPSPEARCLCKSGIRGKHCFDYHPAEARVDWDMEIESIMLDAIHVRSDARNLSFPDFRKSVEKMKDLVQAAFEKGREAR
jgi:hypothetical protein